METVEAGVLRIISEMSGMPEERIRKENNLFDDLGMDSMDCVEMVLAIEEDFYIDIPDQEAGKLQTVQAVIDYVRLNAEVES